MTNLTKRVEKCEKCVDYLEVDIDGELDVCYCNRFKTAVYYKFGLPCESPNACVERELE